MKIKLAGYNVDADQLGYHITDNPQDLTPETISAAYARISRSPKPVNELRADAAADVAKARKSNENIIFEFGHSSVAEHAVFNFDIMDVSRLAIEFIEHHRLNSYTEKSQRYLKLKGLEEVHVPAELKQREVFKSLMQLQMTAYQELRESIFKHFMEGGYPLNKDGPTTAQKDAYKGKSKEDARYVTALAVTGQLGMTINARNLTTMIRRLLGNPLNEVQLVGRQLEYLAKQVVPSLIRYCASEPIRQLHTMALPNVVVACGYAGSTLSEVSSTNLSVVDDSVLTALMFQKSQAPYTVCAAVVEAMPKVDKWRAFCEIYDRMELHSAAPRAFEIPDVVFELTGSASFFAQLKRHRMATILPQPYNVSLGCTVPESIIDANLTGLFETVRSSTEELHDILCGELRPEVAEYVLMQAHRRRVLIKMNARELYAFARLREDSHAQWEIRQVAKKLIKKARETMPMTLALACGKDAFADLKKRLLSHTGYTVATGKMP